MLMSTPPLLPRAAGDGVAGVYAVGCGLTPCDCDPRLDRRAQRIVADRLVDDLAEIAAIAYALYAGGYARL